MGVIQSCNVGYANAGDGRRPGASAWRSISSRHPILDDVLLEALHTKAHRAEGSVVEGTQDWLDFKGNGFADTLAKRGAALHGLPDHLADIVVKQAHKLRTVARHIAAVLELWPATPYPKVPRTLGGRRGRPKAGAPSPHIVCWNGSRWRCLHCFGTFSGRPLSSCPGSAPVLDRIVDADRGHQLCATTVSKSGLLVYCNRCGHYSESRANKLSRPCDVPSSAGRYYLKRIRNHQHPQRLSDSVGHSWRLDVAFAEAHRSDSTLSIGYRRSSKQRLPFLGNVHHGPNSLALSLDDLGHLDACAVESEAGTSDVDL